MTDLQIIKQIEQQFNIKLKKVDEIGWNTKTYIVNNKGNIIGLGLYNCGISDISFLKDLTSLILSPLQKDIFSQISPDRVFLNT